MMRKGHQHCWKKQLTEVRYEAKLVRDYVWVWPKVGELGKGLGYGIGQEIDRLYDSDGVG